MSKWQAERSHTADDMATVDVVAGTAALLGVRAVLNSVPPTQRDGHRQLRRAAITTLDTMQLPTADHLGREVRDRRLALGLSVRAPAARAGISPAYVSAR